ncbi:hypothetical protein [Enterococcus pallens]|uniref:Uncharacterized protein n=1 Tax=Enterococcus pallens ATCC BAA-351 TaxID=1158607 RepID=R2SU97_9ENTE|nr:hypothetical protein [Enterococcus pallens]EOH96376.1 hypothetical protein UAU_01027 [Enterococcus pallens ATCC BAA-351]EOU14411.1 hypothetical protein I588_04767 [Enterococcus pallens ATCC BAA-351]
MIIVDGSDSYETEQMIDIAETPKDQRDSIQRDLINYFSRLAYLRYVNIRTLTSINKCEKMTPDEVRERLNIDRIKKYYSYSADEIHFYIDFAKKYIRIVS